MRTRLAFFILIFLAAPWCAARPHVEIAAENSASVVAVNIMRKDGVFTGTGFVVAENGLIATNKHVVENALYINITFNSGVVSGAGQVLAVHPSADLALIQIEARGLPSVYLGDSDYVRPGEVITVIGNPRRLQNTVSGGLVSAVRIMDAAGPVMQQISAPISPSSSGSPVFNREGDVIGVATFTYKGKQNQNLNFSVPVNYLKDLMRSRGVTPQARTEGKGEVSVWTKIKDYISRCVDVFKKIFK